MPAMTTRFGDLDLSFVLSGTSGFEDLRQQAVTMSLMGRPVAVAPLADVIRSKEAANRPKDQTALPALRLFPAQSALPRHTTFVQTPGSRLLHLGLGLL